MSNQRRLAFLGKVRESISVNSWIDGYDSAMKEVVRIVDCLQQSSESDDYSLALSDITSMCRLNIFCKN